MRKHQLLILIILMLTSVSNSSAQYFKEFDTYVLQDSLMALNTEYITTIKLPPSEFDVNHPNDILEYLSEHLSKDKGNVVRLYDVKKEKRRKTTYKTYADIYSTNKADNPDITSLDKYYQYLRSTLIDDTTKEALIIMFYSPDNNRNVEKIRNYSFFDGVEGCMIVKHSVCSHIVSQEGNIYLSAGWKKKISIPVKFGQVYFIEYHQYKNISKLVPVPFSRGYKICKSYQNLKEKQAN